MTKKGVVIDVKNMDLHTMQEQYGDMMKRVSRIGHKAALAYAGLCAMAYDGARSMAKQGQESWSNAIDRGATMESQASQKLKRLRQELRQRVAKSEEGARKMEKKLEEQATQFVEDLDFPGKDRIQRLQRRTQDVAVVVEETLQAGAKAVTETMDLPIAGYGTFTVKQLKPLLDELDPEQLQAIHAYESAQENRVTILRQIERRLSLLAQQEVEIAGD